MGAPSWAMEPYQSINYVSCHDNNTLFDRIAMSVPDAPFEELTKWNNLAAAFSILALGVPAVLSCYFDLFSGFVQAYVFSLLTMVYIAGSLPEPTGAEA